MRTVFLALFLFAAGFGLVAGGLIDGGQDAAAAIRQSAFVQAVRERAAALAGRAETVAATVSPATTFADHLVAAETALAALERSCSEESRMALGAVFGHLIRATRDVHAGRIAPGRLSAEAARARSSQALMHLQVYARIIDASRNGVLQGRHFPPGAARLMFIEMKTALPAGAPAPPGLADRPASHCQPL